MKFPSVTNVARRLVEINQSAEPDYTAVSNTNDACVDVRLCVDEDGSWIVRSGLVDYDQSHSAYCGASSVPGGKRRFDSREIAKDLLDQCKDQHAMNEDN